MNVEVYEIVGKRVMNNLRSGTGEKGHLSEGPTGVSVILLALNIIKSHHLLFKGICEIVFII